ncbi:PhnD/SsuA/transferrin family substrate-binding protein [Candidatus Endoriftia persephone]|jgi:phosphonate transport system substrate-binding protein|uniref:Phosphonate ABC transporter phosphate-binding periplasmic component n=3 Tax=Gammaproteobacteria TaxID=1236 RepID=G2FDM6_9GAMM|nr:PhnD/SsuA/transferrin family substrate-binding protein [Candidatus Endoriftia persephone]EGV51478.1 hypothetical protein Rifp1Sym_bi00200 [endosymbiont of Riftia pachyptila (vent Ph05)]EGW55081.1 hypothetical protein TevJSym_af00460 [endosymbiont of Tevnia jerichonana (vent Tica)]USF88311.1 PhnD/SsuA/transferrin family substrate-binding protein [Candidatus Endoriftia persephone]
MKTPITTTLLLFTLITAPAHAEVKLSFGVYTSDKPTTMVRQFRPVLKALQARLSDKLGEPVRIRIQVAKNYDQGIEDLVTGKVDFARMGPASYITSKQRNPDLQLLVMESKQGSKTFYGIICVHEQSPIKEIGHLKGRSFAFGSPRSTIGRYLSQHLLLQNGVFAHDLASYKYLGRHDRVGAAVGAGQFDAGALKESTFKKLKKKGTPIRQLVRFPNVTKPWIASSTLNTRTISALKETLLELKDSAALKALKKSGFLPADDSDYAPIRESMQDNEEFFGQSKHS